MSSTDIVIVNVSQTKAPVPDQLQKMGALISQGGTTLSPGTAQVLQERADLTDLLTPAKALASLAWSGNVVTATTSAPHGYPSGQTIEGTIAGATPSGYNGTFPLTITGTTTFTYPLTSDPGAETVPGTVALVSVAEIQEMANTFFGQGNTQACYVLELGATDPAHGVAELDTFITANGTPFYRYLIPRTWDANADFLAFLPDYNSDTARTYFHVTTTTGTYTSYPKAWKSVQAWIEAPTRPATEFTAAANFFVNLNYSPSPTNKVPPNRFAFIFGVTPYPTDGNSALLSTLKAANVNIVGTGSEGGLTDTIVEWGTQMDGRDVSYWYSVDWVQINVKQALANEVINGSNNPQNPLYYDQPGINRLQKRAQQTMNSGTSSGLVLGQALVTAIPFATYVKANPNDYGAGAYNGLAVTYTPNRGFAQITFNVDVTDIPLQ